MSLLWSDLDIQCFARVNPGLDFQSGEGDYANTG